MGKLNPLGALTGFLTGGPVGAVLGSGLVGGGSRPAPAPAAAPTLPALSPQPSRLNQYLGQQAYLRGIREAFGVGSGETYDPWAAIGQGTTPTGTRQQANQAGGQAYPRMLGPGQGQNRLALGYGPGGSQGFGATLNRAGRGGGEEAGRGGGAGGSGEGRGAGSAQDLYGRYITQALSGYGGLPVNVQQSAFSRGLAALNTQAQAGASAYAGQMGRRGLLQSGIYGQGMAGLERSRLAGVSALAGGLEQQGLAAARSAQQRAAELFAAEREGAAGRAYGLQYQGRQISAAEPKWYDILGGLAGTYAQYRYQPQPYDFSRLFGTNIAPGAPLGGNPMPGLPVDKFGPRPPYGKW